MARQIQSENCVFTAIDFETADHGRDSACAIGAVVVKNGRITDRFYELIRPPRPDFVFTYIHGITWDDVANCSTFADIWSDLERLIRKSDFLVAHYAPFDRSVLTACCEAADISVPEKRFACTVQVARRTWDLPSARLPVVCEHLGIRLRHHDALSDAEACARIAIKAMKAGSEL